MGSIRVLDSALVDQIAAGEVVERPASVVKELLDNALDAGATTVRVDISEGGRERIRVSDDGVGMDPEDAEMCVRRHATSKLSRFEDFRRLRTMGFRGEALASIASVSRFRLVTRSRDAIAGTEVRVKGGGAPQLREIGAPPGTTVDVQDLFFNVPARRKFLKARQTESHHVAEACLKAALARPALRLSLWSNGRRVREYLPAESRTARARAVFADQDLVELAGAHDGLELQAALGPPARARSGARHLYLFVNDRPVVDRGLARAVAFAFGDALQAGRYPAGVVFLQLPLEEVDVNAHPQKTEVRFARASRVYDAVTRVVARGLGTRSWGGGIRGSVASAQVGPAARGAAFWDARLRPGPSLGAADGAPHEAARSPDVAPPLREDPADDRWGLRRALRGEDLARDRRPPYGPSGATAGKATSTSAGRSPSPARRSVDHAGDAERTRPGAASVVAERVGATSDAAAPGAERPAATTDGIPLAALPGVWLTVRDDVLLAVDALAAARALTLAAWSDGIATQRLLFPARVELTPADATFVEERRSGLHALGLDTTLVGPGTVAVHTLPSIHPAVRAAEPDPGRVLAAAIDALRRDLPSAAARTRLAAALLGRIDPACGAQLLAALDGLTDDVRASVERRWTAQELLGRGR